jgi:hypothetical protein
MAKGIQTRRAKRLKKGHQSGTSKFGSAAWKVTPEPKGPSVPGKSKIAGDKANTKGTGRLETASPATRGKLHDLSSSGRRTTARTQGGATKGSGKRHDW